MCLSEGQVDLMVSYYVIVRRWYILSCVIDHQNSLIFRIWNLCNDLVSGTYNGVDLRYITVIERTFTACEVDNLLSHDNSLETK